MAPRRWERATAGGPAEPERPMTSPMHASDEVKIVTGFVEACNVDRSRLMDIVHAVQNRFGYISDSAIHTIATALGMHAVEVEDMASFYAFFDREPRGRNRIRLSRTPISLMKGAKEVARAFEETLGISMGGTSTDGEFTVEWTSDVGMADQEPAALVNGAILTLLRRRMRPRSSPRFGRPAATIACLPRITRRLRCCRRRSCDRVLCRPGRFCLVLSKVPRGSKPRWPYRPIR
jgi:NADH:ubiquinone oxidoreductase subunit E